MLHIHASPEQLRRVERRAIDQSRDALPELVGRCDRLLRRAPYACGLRRESFRTTLRTRVVLRVVAPHVEGVPQHLETKILQGRRPGQIHRLQLGYEPRCAGGIALAQIRDDPIHQRGFAYAGISNHHDPGLRVVRETTQDLFAIVISADEEPLQVRLRRVLLEGFLKEWAACQPEPRPEGHIGAGERVAYNRSFYL